MAVDTLLPSAWRNDRPKDLDPVPARSRGCQPQGVRCEAAGRDSPYSVSPECQDLADSDTRLSQGANEEGQTLQYQQDPRHQASVFPSVSHWQPG